ncbi:MAG: hypothetical protein EA365_00580 [Gloeocapsa sp. DLM2.Bin57]|nr:MAG: hypothetical protein EA365_00580 [Gloeocapsa sp. DLM2.Bin57]
MEYGKRIKKSTYVTPNVMLKLKEYCLEHGISESRAIELAISRLVDEPQTISLTTERSNIEGGLEARLEALEARINEALDIYSTYEYDYDNNLVHMAKYMAETTSEVKVSKLKKAVAKALETLGTDLYEFFV